MHTICPNCLRPVRTGAKYCGFCGTSLNSNSEVDVIASPARQEQSDPESSTKSTRSAGPTYDRTGRTVSIIAIILLFMVIVAAFTMRYWPNIIGWLGQILPGMNFQ